LFKYKVCNPYKKYSSGESMQRSRYNISIAVFALIFASLTACSHVRPSEEPVAEPQYEKGVIQKVANLREGPSLQSPIIEKVGSGTTVTIIEKQGEWYRVALDDGTEAYVHKALVKLSSSLAFQKPAVTLPSVTTPQTPFEPVRSFILLQGANMRSGPGKEYDPPAAFVKEGAEFIARGRTGNWFYGTGQGKTGWIHNSLLGVEGNIPYSKTKDMDGGTTPHGGESDPYPKTTSSDSDEGLPLFGPKNEIAR
jgi:N-acetylmuramoyl-L-alanine amidase